MRRIFNRSTPNFKLKHRPTYESSSRKKLIIGVGVAVGLLLLLLIVQRSELFRIKQIKVIGNSGFCVNDQVISASLVNRSFINFIPQKERDLLKRKYLCVANVEFKKILPNKLEVHIQERVGALVLRSIRSDIQAAPSPSSDPFLNLIEASGSAEASSSAKLWDFSIQDSNPASFLVDGTGFVYTKVEGSANLPIIIFEPAGLKLGDKLSNQAGVKILDILMSLGGLAFDTTRVKMIDQKYLLVDSQPRVAFSLLKESKVQLASLQLILQEAKINSKGLESVDLRFIQPVVVYSSKTK